MNEDTQFEPKAEMVVEPVEDIDTVSVTEAEPTEEVSEEQSENFDLSGELPNEKMFTREEYDQQAIGIDLLNWTREAMKEVGLKGAEDWLKKQIDDEAKFASYPMSYQRAIINKCIRVEFSKLTAFPEIDTREARYHQLNEGSVEDWQKYTKEIVLPGLKDAFEKAAEIEKAKEKLEDGVFREIDESTQEVDETTVVEDNG